MVFLHQFAKLFVDVVITKASVIANDLMNLKSSQFLMRFQRLRHVVCGLRIGAKDHAILTDCGVARDERPGGLMIQARFPITSI